MAKKKRQSDPHEGSDSSTESGNDRNNSGSGMKGGCLHIKRSVDLNNIRKWTKSPKFDHTKCIDCAKPSTPSSPTVEQSDINDFEYDRTLWMCLKCGVCSCGRTENKHALKHYEVSGF